MKKVFKLSSEMLSDAIEKEFPYKGNRDEFLSKVWAELQRYKKRSIAFESIVVNPDNIILKTGRDWIVQDIIDQSGLKTYATVFGIQIIRSYDLDPNEFKIVSKLP